MHTNAYIRWRLLFILLFTAGMGACDKLLEVPSPPNEISIDQTFNDSATATAAILGIYNRMVSHGLFEWCGLSYNTARSADETLYNFNPDYFALDSLLYTDAQVQQMWEQGFSSLFTINTCIKGVQAGSQLSPALQRQLLVKPFFAGHS